ncbi:hypothetical protein [Paenibacillus sp. O199]|uniref:hypothetical protein n=1 Tax=Paenibacillus sp. O199 TaxID=1643925 RepID=UPI000A932E35|nr:hypothetical protein [Paenibacillus sp. O199]
MITNYNPMFGSKEQCEDLVRQIKENNKTQEENVNMKEIIVVVDLNRQIKEKYDIFKTIMGEGVEGSIHRDRAELTNGDAKVRIISSSGIGGQRGDHVLDMSKKNDKEYVDAVRRMEVRKREVPNDDPYVKLQKMGINTNDLSTLSQLNAAKAVVGLNLANEAIEYSELLDRAYELNMWVVANPPVK